MANNSIYDKIIAIHDEALSVLSAMHIPPYPIHYQKQFNKIFDAITDSTLKSALNNNSSIDEKLDSMVKYIELAKAAIDSFADAHNNISNVAAMQCELLDSYSRTIPRDNTHDHCIRMADGLTKLGTDMATELRKSEETISHLHERLDDAMLAITTDPLTHLLNHRKYMEDLGDILVNGTDRDLPLLSLMINTDTFKEINDEFGHLAGDKVLFFLAQTIKAMVRAGDYVYRYAGDQFAVLINRCESDKALGIAEKIRHKVEHSHLIYNGKTIEVTVSIGATMHRANDDIDGFIKRTGMGLIKSKELGKNQIIFT
ncbi:MAG: GGDEF domain-containing protein [Sulfuricurvum sp.]|nr:GGDEF domain-containing protein [Sulfuricurvum sp.]